MDNEKIKVQVDSEQILEVVVSNKQVEAIWIVLGEGVHNTKCKLTPTRNKLAYAGNIMGREIIFERSVEQVQEEIDRRDQVSFMRVKR